MKRDCKEGFYPEKCELKPSSPADASLPPPPIAQVPCYPYQGEQLGEVGPHKNCRNIPVQAGTTWDGGYRELFTEHALPFLSDEGGPWGRPDIVIVCAGYDACAADEMAGVSLQPQDFGEMAAALRRHVGRDVPVALGLEGGYDFESTAAALTATIEGLGR